MQVKKFEAPTMQEALALVKTELGPEAIILSTKNHRKGFGLLSKASVEVTAAVSDKSLNKKLVTEKIVSPQTRDAINKLSPSKQADVYEEFTGYVKKRGEDQRRRHAPAQATSSQGSRQRMPDRSGLGALMGDDQPGAWSTPSSKGQKARAPQQQAVAAKATGASNRYVDIGDDDDDAGSGAQTAAAYGRNGRVASDAAEAARAQPAAPPRASAARAAMAASLEAHESYGAGESHETAGMQAAVLAGEPGEFKTMQDEIQRLKSMIEEIKTEQTTLTDARIPETTTDEIQAEYNNLLRNGIDKRHATPLIKQVAFALPREAIRSTAKIVEALAVEMMNNLKVDHPFEFKSGTDSKVFALIGPTGVGKTTTIAKLASQAILQKNLRVGLINVDSYKVAALDQLATYAKILNVPFRQASNAAELDRALTEFKPLDLVLIDTSGRSQRDSESLSQMRQLLADSPAVRPLLIMSATTRDQELYDIITRFKIFNATGLVFSKLDETSTFGCIYNVAVKTGLPLTYFTVGQRVPEDIEPASKERVADLILDL